MYVGTSCKKLREISIHNLHAAGNHTEMDFVQTDDLKMRRKVIPTLVYSPSVDRNYFVPFHLKIHKTNNINLDG